MTRSKVFWLLIVGLIFGPASLQAMTMRLEATTAAISYSGFDLLFDDTGDELLQIGEITYFSGVTYDGQLFTSVQQLPAIADVSTFGMGPLPSGCIVGNVWCFRYERPNGWGAVSGSGLRFTYTITQAPEPGTLALLGLGLAGLGLSRRRRAV